MGEQWQEDLAEALKDPKAQFQAMVFTAATGTDLQFKEGILWAAGRITELESNERDLIEAYDKYVNHLIDSDDGYHWEQKRTELFGAVFDVIRNIKNSD